MDGENPTSGDCQPYYFFFGLIVTGKSEREHLPKLFRTLMATGICTFEVIRRVDQLRPITSKERLKGIRKGRDILDKDEKIGLEARKYLTPDAYRFVVLVDDLEYDHRNQAQQVFDRYRQAFDTILTTNQKRRASVHFFVNMLEAYYLADAKAVNAVLGTSLIDYEDDMEDIRSPIGQLQNRFPGFDKVEHGGKILEQLDVEHVLSRPDTCASLRTLFAWCVKVLERHPNYQSLSLIDKYQLHNGKLSAITRAQLDEGWS